MRAASRHITLLPSNTLPMLRRLGLTITIAILAIFVLVIALWLQEPDSAPMRLLNLKKAQLHLHTQARRAFTPFAPQIPILGRSASNMASSDINKDAPSSGVAEERIAAESQDGTPLGLPAPPSEGEAIQLDMSSGGDTVKLDSLGPMVVNTDGTISRIGNWDQMTEMEKKNTLRIVGKRNKQRMDKLKAAEDGVVDDK